MECDLWLWGISTKELLHRAVSIAPPHEADQCSFTCGSVRRTISLDIVSSATFT